MDEEIMTTEAQEPVSTVETASETTPETTATAPQPTERVFTESQVQSMMKDRLRKYGDYDQYREIVAGLEELGYTRDTVKAQIAEMRKAKEAETYQKAGIDPDTFNQLVESHPVVRELLSERENSRMERGFGELANSYPWAGENHVANPEFKALLKQGLSPLRAFNALYAQEIVAQAQHSGEQQALANVVGRNSKQVQGGDVPGASKKLNPASMNDDEFSELMARVERGERVILR